METVVQQIAALGRMTVTQLRSKHIEVFGEATRSDHKDYLVKRIAWRIQANAWGDLSCRARRRAVELANDANLRTTAPRTALAGVQSEDGRKPAVFTISRTGPVTSDLVVYYTLGGTAIGATGTYPDGISLDGVDYVTPTLDSSGYYKITIPSGKSQVDVTINTLNDSDVDEDLETIELTIVDAPEGFPGFGLYAPTAGNPASRPATRAADLKPLVIQSTPQYEADPQEPDHATVIDPLLAQLYGSNTPAVREQSEAALKQHGLQYPRLRVYYEAKYREELAKQDSDPEFLLRISAVIAATHMPLGIYVDHGQLFVVTPNPGAGVVAEARVDVTGSPSVTLQRQGWNFTRQAATILTGSGYQEGVRLVALKAGTVRIKLTIFRRQAEDPWPTVPGSVIEREFIIDVVEGGQP